jgi:hypothetical protein
MTMSWVNEGTHDIGDTVIRLNLEEKAVRDQVVCEPYCWTHEVPIDAENAEEHGVRFVDDERSDEFDPEWWATAG